MVMTGNWRAAVAALWLAGAPLVCQADINVIGANTCETWTAERAKGVSGASWERPWVLGYLSGIARVSNIDMLKAADPNKLLAWIDRFCKDNPTANVAQAAEVLTQTLVRTMDDSQGAGTGADPTKSGPAPSNNAPGSATPDAGKGSSK